MRDREVLRGGDGSNVRIRGHRHCTRHNSAAIGRQTTCRNLTGGFSPTEQQPAVPPLPPGPHDLGRLAHDPLLRLERHERFTAASCLVPHPPAPLKHGACWQTYPFTSWSTKVCAPPLLWRGILLPDLCAPKRMWHSETKERGKSRELESETLLFPVIQRLKMSKVHALPVLCLLFTARPARY